VPNLTSGYGNWQHSASRVGEELEKSPVWMATCPQKPKWFIVQNIHKRFQARNWENWLMVQIRPFYYPAQQHPIAWLFTLFLICFCSSSAKMRPQPFWARRNVSPHGYLQWRKPRPHIFMRSTKCSTDPLQGGFKKGSWWKQAQEVTPAEKVQNHQFLNCNWHRE
jgi:hypothetical protein